MTDVLTREQRHRCMSRIRSKNTKPEVTLRSAVWARGLRYRLHDSRLPGRPDMAFISAKVAVFVDGCFFHGCPDHAVLPKTNRYFWGRKLSANVRRDRHVDAELRAIGWRAIRIWEHEVKSNLDSAVIRLILELGESSQPLREGPASR